MAGQPAVFSMFYGPSVFVLGTPGSSEAIASPGNHSGVRQLTGSMGLSPLRGSHRAAWAFAQTEVSLFCDASLLYAGSCPALTGRFPLMSRKTVMAFTAAVAPHHRFVPDECIFSCEGASDFSVRNNSVATSKILCKNGRFYRDAGRPVLPENRPLYDPFAYFRSFMSPARISWAAESCF